MSKNFEYILFDLVGVLINPSVTFENTYLKDNNISLFEFFKDWSISNAVKEFESGKISEEEFGKSRVAELDIKISPEIFINILKSMRTPLYNGVKEFLDRLSKQGFKLACLSNTNSIHWNRIENKDILDKYFLHKFLSYEIGFVKPQQEIYLHAINLLDVPADKIIYFDDLKENVDAAKNCGLNAICVYGFDDLQVKIKEFIKS